MSITHLFVPVKLPSYVVTIGIPDISTTLQTLINYDERITEDGETRITEDGEVRIVDGFEIFAYPEIMAIKLPDNRITVVLP